MAGSVNKVILVGNLGADPEVKSFQNGGRIVNLRIATSENWKDKATGERKERTDWHTVVINSEGLIGVVERYLRKGSKIYIEGQLRHRKYQDKDGNERWISEVAVGMNGVMTMLDGPPAGAGGGARAGGGSSWGDEVPRGGAGDRPSGAGGGFGGDSRGGGSKAPFGDDLDDDIPF